MEGLQRCFVLHTRPYSETSLILDVFSEDSGRLTLLSKGARRKRSNLKGALQPFTPLFMKWSGKGSMPVLTHAEPISIGLPMRSYILYSAMYVNELLARVLETDTPYPVLFLDYLNVLRELAQAENPEPALRRFELALLDHLGYGVDFLHCAGSGLPVDDTMTYNYREQRGFIASLTVGQLTFTGEQLKAIAARRFENPDQLRAAKRFTRIALKPYLGGKPLKSRELFIPRGRSTGK
ncbi:DNA repair protein RecO [Photobacterium gaetbulicola]|uniref:DNA repair protein RecO n=1 Tax=Photobacterium gaetbulicola Gung47 TaxID=658445 RepID=A0A0C5WWR2_9GAMM|nr:MULTISPECIES: DNA repair protein RecO [Photobacterium]AJR07540.1 DNA repair protein RecO [Photobacterium gaetbulicola Gung47]PSU04502.1 DNA repair protein RecO [Photobacterium gaetbulicola]WEM42754.1 DNA repair protein RecO [Photobacterium sp. DA100]